MDRPRRCVKQGVARTGDSSAERAAASDRDATVNSRSVDLRGRDLRLLATTNGPDRWIRLGPDCWRFGLRLHGLP